MIHTTSITPMKEHEKHMAKPPLDSFQKRAALPRELVVVCSRCCHSSTPLHLLWAPRRRDAEEAEEGNDQRYASPELSIRGGESVQLYLSASEHEFFFFWLDRRHPASAKSRQGGFRHTEALATSAKSTRGWAPSLVEPAEPWFIRLFGEMADC